MKGGENMKKMTSLLAGLALSLGVLGVFNVAQAADQDTVARGQYLARAGDCMACHSAAGKPATVSSAAVSGDASDKAAARPCVLAGEAVLVRSGTRSSSSTAPN